MVAIAVARVLHGTTAEGPFLRTAIWVQGCSIRCAGCINPHLFEPGGSQFEVSSLAADAVAAGVEGLTLLGGEPFDQADGCAALADTARAAGLGVITFTGYAIEELRARPTAGAANRLLAATDLLVDGPYEHGRPEEVRALVGSSNQRFHHLTDRYEGFDPVMHRNRVDLRVGPDGETRLAGFLTRPDLHVLSGTRHVRPTDE